MNWLRRRREPELKVTYEDVNPPPTIDWLAMTAGLTRDEFDIWRREHGDDPYPVGRWAHWDVIEQLREWKATRLSEPAGTGEPPR